MSSLPGRARVIDPDQHGYAHGPSRLVRKFDEKRGGKKAVSGIPPTPFMFE
jgi:hypothetical protein